MTERPALERQAPPGLSVSTIVAASAAVAAIGMGLRQVLGLFLKPMTMEIAVGREDFALSVAIANLVWGMMAPFMGAVGDRYGAAPIVAAGGLATAAGLALMAVAASPAALYGAGILLGIGVSGTGVSALVGTAARAAGPDHRTRAIAVVGMGSGVGILVALPYTHLLMDVVGWRNALAVLAATALSTLLLALLLRQGGVAAPAAPRSSTAREALAEAFRHRDFWLLNLGFFVCGFHVVFYATHLPPYVADLGLAPGVAVTALMATGVGNLVGTWIAGEWGRVLPKRYGLALIYSGRALVFLGFLYLPATPAMIIVSSALLGLLWLSTVPLTSGLVATMFGTGWMTMLFGVVFLSHQVGSFLGAWLGGRAFDALGSYDVMWWISVALGLIAAALSLPVRERSASTLQAEPA